MPVPPATPQNPSLPPPWPAGDGPAAQASPGSAAAGPALRQEVREEVGGPTGLEPTRYGDWERGGRCIDF